MLRRLTPTFWLSLCVGGALLIVIVIGVSRELFRDRLSPNYAPTRAALLPTLVASATATRAPAATNAPRSVATSAVALAPHAARMQADAAGYMLPTDAQAALQKVIEGGLDFMDRFSWEDKRDGPSLFIADALAQVTALGSDDDLYTKTIASSHRMTALCDATGATCAVTMIYGGLTLDTYDPGTHNRLERLTLDTDLSYAFSMTVRWTAEGWRIAGFYSPTTVVSQ